MLRWHHHQRLLHSKLTTDAAFIRGACMFEDQRVGALVPAPFDPGEEPEPASFAPLLFAVPERLPPPVVGPLPAAPGEAPEPASFGPVLLAVPDRLVPGEPDPPSAA